MDKTVLVNAVARMVAPAIALMVDALVLRAGTVHPVTPLALLGGMAHLVLNYVAVGMVIAQGLMVHALVLLDGREIFVNRVAPKEHGALIV